MKRSSTRSSIHKRWFRTGTKDRFDGLKRSMKIALFVPCYIDAFFPEVAIATLQLLERLGHQVEYPSGQTCCGQPMANSGDQSAAAATEVHFAECFREYDVIVGPSGSCVHHLRFHLDACEQTPEVLHVRKAVRELVEFLHDDLGNQDQRSGQTSGRFRTRADRSRGRVLRLRGKFLRDR
jgi:Fe-S oxidoreductase